MDMTEKTLRRIYRFEGRIMKARTDEVLLPNGKKAGREVCEHMGGVAVLPLFDNGDVLLVRQFRYPYGQVILEAPAGKMDQGPEGHLICGTRELSEETGLSAREMIYLGEMYPSPGFLTEILYMYCARGLTEGEKHLDEDEFLETVRMPFEEMLGRIASGEIKDAKTIAIACKMQLLGLVGA